MNNKNKDKKIKEVIEYITDEYLVMGLIMQKCNMNMNDSLWEVIKQRSCKDRYKCYAKLV